MSQHKDYYHEVNYHKEPKRNEILDQLPFVGDISEPLRKYGIGKKGIKKLACCCAPLALILLIPVVMVIYWLTKSALSLFKIDLTNVNWIEQTKNWLISNFQLDQISEWVGQFQALQGILGQ